LTINNTNRCPTLAAIPDLAVDVGTLITVQARGTDMDLDALTYSASGLPSGSAMNAVSGEFVWTPVVGQEGSHTVTMRVADSDLSATETFTINVNDPTAVTPDEPRDSDGGSGSTGTTDGSATDAQGTSTGETSTGSGSSVRGDRVVIGGGRLVPNALAQGDNAADGDDPAALLGGIPTQRIEVGERIRVEIPVTNPERHQLIFGAEELPRGARISKRRGIFTWRPRSNQVGTHQIAVSVEVGDETRRKAFTVQVTPAPPPNRSPVIQGIPDQVVVAGRVVSFRVVANDPDGDTLTYRALDIPEGATFASNNVFRWRPAADIYGVHIAIFEVTDQQYTSLIQVPIIVQGREDYPASPYVTQSDGPAPAAPDDAIDADDGVPVESDQDVISSVTQDEPV
jgi:hypothetical protein